MTSTTRSGLAVLLLALGARAGLSEDEPKKLDLSTPDRWEKGEVVTWAEKIDNEMETSFRDAAGKEVEPPKGLAVPGARRSARTHIKSVIVVRCDEVDAKGRPSRCTAFVREWSVKLKDADAPEDTSLKGALVEIARNKWKLASPDVKPSHAAEAWLRNTFGPQASFPESTFASFAGEALVAVGGAWRAPMRSILRFNQEKCSEGVAILPEDERFRADMKLVAAEGPDVRAAATIDRAIDGELAMGSSSLELAPGSRLKIDAELACVLGRSHRTGKMRAVMEMSVGMDQGDVVVWAKGRATVETTRTAGGEMPDPPKKKTDPAPPAPPPSPPKAPDAK